MGDKSGKRDDRTEAQLIEHYEIEKKLAQRLRNASKEERATLYTSLYEELFRRVPHHTQLTRKASPKERQEDVNYEMSLLKSFLGDNLSFLEVGPGDCSLSFAVAKFVKDVYAIDVSESITKRANAPDNFHLILSDGCSINAPANSIDVAYSNQLMEHLHPDDAFDQLKNIHRALVPGGVYLCVTPNKLNGPHDISKHFDRVASGFHLKEYTVTELGKLFKRVGFAKARILIGARGVYIRFPLFPAILCETLLKLLPHRLRRKAANFKVIKALISIRLIGIKSAKPQL